MDVRFSSQQYLKHKSSLKNDFRGSKMSRKLKKNGLAKGPFNNYVDKMRRGGGQKMSFFVHAQGIKTPRVRRDVKKSLFLRNETVFLL
jgi:hypothetical protein